MCGWFATSDDGHELEAISSVRVQLLTSALRERLPILLRVAFVVVVGQSNGGHPAKCEDRLSSCTQEFKDQI